MNYEAGGSLWSRVQECALNSVRTRREMIFKLHFYFPSFKFSYVLINKPSLCFFFQVKCTRELNVVTAVELHLAELALLVLFLCSRCYFEHSDLLLNWEIVVFFYTKLLWHCNKIKEQKLAEFGEYEDISQSGARKCAHLNENKEKRK
jgi:hypothetical protein